MPNDRNISESQQAICAFIVDEFDRLNITKHPLRSRAKAGNWDDVEWVIANKPDAPFTQSILDKYEKMSDSDIQKLVEQYRKEGRL